MLVGARRTGSGWLFSWRRLPWLGFVPDNVASAPAAAVARLAEQLGLDPGALQGYGKRAQTRTDHLKLVGEVSGVEDRARPAAAAMKELEQFLLDRAMEHDSPTLLFNLAREYLMAGKVIRPGAVTLAKMVGAAREDAARLTSQKVAHLLTAAGPPGPGPAADVRRRAGDDAAGVADQPRRRRRPRVR